MRQLDMTLICAKDLKDVHVQGNMDLYAVATLSNDPHNGKRTPIDRGCGKNANWNCSIQFNIPESVDGDKLAVDILIQCQMPSGDRNVGEVHIPVKELEYGGERKFVSYQVWTSSGNARGVLDLSYKFATPGNMPPAMIPPVRYPPTSVGGKQPPMTQPCPSTFSGYAPQPATGYPCPSASLHWYRAQPSHSVYSAPPPARSPGCCRPPQSAGSPGSDTQVQQPSKMSKFGSILGTAMLVIVSVIGGVVASEVIRDAAGDAKRDVSDDDE